jgi:hypothetical protein
MESDGEYMSEEAKLEFMKNVLLSKKEKNEEKFLDDLMTSFEKNDFEAAASADLNQQEKLQQAQLKLADTSIILAHRFSPLLKQYVANKEQKLLNEKFAVIKSKKTSTEEMAENYRVCFNTWINAKEDVHLKVSKPADQLGKISIDHAFTLIFFSFLTNRRQPGDNMLQLVISGLNSCGKTMIFENPLLEVAHMVTTEKGVSRFNFDAKSTMLMHDVNLTNLVKSADCDRLKAIARGEPVPTKTRGSVQTVPSVFSIITSNQHLFTHTFPIIGKSRKSFENVFKSDIGPTTNIHPSDIAAVQARYLEAFVRSRPEIEERFIPKSENFQRKHAIMGLFAQVVDILCLYEKKDYKSEYYYLYPIGGLCKQLHLMPEESNKELRENLFFLMNRYELDEEQINACCKDMNIGQPENELSKQ